MKVLKTVDLRSKSVEELKQQCLSLRKDILAWRMKRPGDTGVKPHIIVVLRLSLARTMTILHEKERASA